MSIRFVKWQRKPDAPLGGWPEILVYETGSEEEPALVPVVMGQRKNEVQCATVDRIPFAMPESRLLDRYERAK